MLFSIKIKNKIHLLLPLFLLHITACKDSSKEKKQGYQTWSKEKYDTFKAECEAQIHFNFERHPILFSGFSDDEIDTFMIIEKVDSVIRDSLYMLPHNRLSHYNRESNTYSVLEEYEFNINHQYEFYLDSDTPYVLHDMEMIVWSENTMTTENWGCLMGNYWIDDNQLEQRGNVIINKRKIKTGS